MAGTLENYSVSCQLTFLSRKIENWIFFSILDPSQPTLCSEYPHCGPHPLHPSKAGSSASCPQQGKASGLRLIWGTARKLSKVQGAEVSG